MKTTATIASVPQESVVAKTWELHSTEIVLAISIFPLLLILAKLWGVLPSPRRHPHR